MLALQLFLLCSVKNLPKSIFLNLFISAAIFCFKHKSEQNLATTNKLYDFKFQFGFMDMNVDGTSGMDDDGDDDDLEAELLALTSDSSASKPKKRNVFVL